MNQPPPDVKLANILFILFWMVVVLVLWIFGRRWQVTRAFRERMMAGWKPALVITLIFAVSMGIEGHGWLNPYDVAIFCQVLVGLALARGIPNHEPLPVARSIILRDRPHGMYRTFWQFPISQFVATVLIGLIWGYVYVKRGFETVVLAHTLSDWISFMIFSN